MLRDQKWMKHRICVENWKANNKEYYLEQKRRLAHRPEYLARRREMYALKKGCLRSEDDQENNISTKSTHAIA